MAIEINLQGRTAVVTGASSGIGAAIARRLGAHGALVYLVGRAVAPLREAKATIEQAGGKAEIAVLDVRETGALVALIDRAADDTGSLDVMVNNAGVSYPEPVLASDETKWREMFEVNVLALLAGAQAAVRAMRRHGSGGHIVNISSTDALVLGNGVYGATKAAVAYLTHVLRRELEDDAIRVTAVTPGPVATNVIRNFDPAILQGLAAAVGLDLVVRPGEGLPSEALGRVQRAMDQQIANPDDIAEAVLYIVSQPLRLNIADIVLRPAKTLTM